MTASALAGGCQAFQSLGQSLQRPSARITGARLDNITLESAAVNFDIEVTNPYPAALPLVNLKYALSATGATQPFVSGAADVQGSVPANSSKTLTVPAKVVFSQLLQVLQEVKPGSVVPYDATLTMSVNAPQVGALDLPLKHQGQLPIPTVPAVSLAGVQWQGLTPEKADALVRVNVTNRNQFPFDLSKLSMNLSVNGSKLVTIEQPQSAHFDPAGQQTLEIPINFAPKALGLGALSALRGQGTQYGLSGLFDLNTPFGPMQLPYSTGTQGAGGGL
jgi:LEA14-like dessication related protein